MKIHLQPAIPYDPSSFTIAKARILPNADTMRLTTYHNAILQIQISTEFHLRETTLTVSGPHIAYTNNSTNTYNTVKTPPQKSQ
jgi:hypothetical protein